MTSGGILLFLVLVQVKHYLADYQWQTLAMLANKGRYLHPAGLAHAGLHAALSVPVMLLAGFGGLGLVLSLAVAELLLHHHIDWVKLRVQKNSRDFENPRFWRLLGLDQAMHQLTYAGMLAIAMLL